MRINPGSPTRQPVSWARPSQDPGRGARAAKGAPAKEEGLGGAPSRRTRARARARARPAPALGRRARRAGGPNATSSLPVTQRPVRGPPRVNSFNLHWQLPPPVIAAALLTRGCPPLSSLAAASARPCRSLPLSSTRNLHPSSLPLSFTGSVSTQNRRAHCQSLSPPSHTHTLH